MKISVKIEMEVEDLEDKIERDSFVLVNISSKKTSKLYVAEVISINKDRFEVNYLKKVPETRKFIREDDTIYELDKNYVIFKLPQPMFVEGSSRQRQNLFFEIELSRYNVE